MHKHLKRICLPLVLLAAPAYADMDGEDIWKDAKVEFSLRYRYAHIDQAGFDRKANASTLRSLLGIRTGDVGGFYGYLQMRNVARIGPDNFNDTLSGKTQFPVAADPSSTEFQQAYLGFERRNKLHVTFGRRQLSWGNQRFISALNWRQNPNSFDGLTIESQPVEGLELKYAYAFNVNRAFTDRSPVGNFDGNFHLMNLGYKLGDWGKATIYGYFLDQNDDFAQALASNSYGINFEGSRTFGDVNLGYVLEYAEQKDRGANPFDYAASYKRIEPKLTYRGFQVRAGYEELSGDGNQAFQTPLALLHAFNGRADVFLTTPAGGLRDSYAEMQYTMPSAGMLSGLNATVAYHHFESDVTGAKYGTEWDASLSKNLFGKVNASAVVANYGADGFASDRTKFWFILSSKF